MTWSDYVGNRWAGSSEILPRNVTPEILLRTFRKVWDRKCMPPWLWSLRETAPPGFGTVWSCRHRRWNMLPGFSPSPESKAKHYSLTEASTRARSPTSSWGCTRTRVRAGRNMQQFSMRFLKLMVPAREDHCGRVLSSLKTRMRPGTHGHIRLRFKARFELSTGMCGFSFYHIPIAEVISKFSILTIDCRGGRHRLVSSFLGPNNGDCEAQPHEGSEEKRVVHDDLVRWEEPAIIDGTTQRSSEEAWRQSWSVVRRLPISRGAFCVARLRKHPSLTPQSTESDELDPDKSMLFAACRDAPSTLYTFRCSGHCYFGTNFSDKAKLSGTQNHRNQHEMPEGCTTHQSLSEYPR